MFKWLTNKNYNDLISTNTRKEIKFLDKLEQALQPFDIIGVRQYRILNYKIDYYIPSLRIAIEYDENNHNNYTYEQQEGRQAKIENELGCKFIRVNDKDTDEYNIGLIINRMLEIAINRLSKDSLNIVNKKIKSILN